MDASLDYDCTLPMALHLFSPNLRVGLGARRFSGSVDLDAILKPDVTTTESFSHPAVKHVSKFFGLGNFFHHSTDADEDDSLDTSFLLKHLTYDRLSVGVEAMTNVSSLLPSSLQEFSVHFPGIHYEVAIGNEGWDSTTWSAGIPKFSIDFARCDDAEILFNLGCTPDSNSTGLFGYASALMAELGPNMTALEKRVQRVIDKFLPQYQVESILGNIAASLEALSRMEGDDESGFCSFAQPLASLVLAGVGGEPWRMELENTGSSFFDALLGSHVLEVSASGMDMTRSSPASHARTLLADDDDDDDAYFQLEMGVPCITSKYADYETGKTDYKLKICAPTDKWTANADETEWTSDFVTSWIEVTTDIVSMNYTMDLTGSGPMASRDDDDNLGKTLKYGKVDAQFKEFPDDTYLGMSLRLEDSQTKAEYLMESMLNQGVNMSFIVTDQWGMARNDDGEYLLELYGTVDVDEDDLGGHAAMIDRSKLGDFENLIKFTVAGLGKSVNPDL